MAAKRHKGRPARNPNPQLKAMLSQLGAPSEGLKQTIVELQTMNQKLHDTNKNLVQTMGEILDEFDLRLQKLEIAQFGVPDLGFDKHKGEKNVQLSDVRDSVETPGDTAPTDKVAGSGGFESEGDGPDGNPEGDSSVQGVL